MRTFSMLSAFALCLMAADGGEPGGGAGGGAPPPAGDKGAGAGGAPGAADKGKPPPSGEGDDFVKIPRKDYDAQLADRAQRAASKEREKLIAKYKDAGITSEEELDKLVKASKEKADAEKSELQKLGEKASKHESDAKSAAAERDAAKEELRRFRVFSGAGIKDAEVASILLDKAKAEDPSLDEKKWLDGLKKDRAYLFGEAPAPLANSGQKPGGEKPATGGGAGSGKDDQPADLSKLSPEELGKKARAMGIDPRLIGGR